MTKKLKLMIWKNPHCEIEMVSIFFGVELKSGSWCKRWCFFAIKFCWSVLLKTIDLSWWVFVCQEAIKDKGSWSWIVHLGVCDNFLFWMPFSIEGHNTDRCPLDLGRFSKGKSRIRVLCCGGSRAPLKWRFRYRERERERESEWAKGAKVTHYSLRRSANSKTISRSWKHHNIDRSCCALSLHTFNSIPYFEASLSLSLCGWTRRYPFFSFLFCHWLRCISGATKQAKSLARTIIKAVKQTKFNSSLPFVEWNMTHGELGTILVLSQLCSVSSRFHICFFQSSDG